MVLKAVKELLKCARVDLYSITQDQNEMIWHDVDMAATQNLSQSPDLVLKLEGLVGHAVTSRKPVNVFPVRNHPLFVAQADQRSDRCHPTSTLIVPMLVAQGTLHEASIGAIQATNKLDGTPFDNDDETLLEKLASLTASSIYHNNRQNRQARLVTVLSHICTTLDVNTLLHRTVECVRDWSHGKALAIRIWVRDPRTDVLVLCALEYAGKRAYIRNHLVEDGNLRQERADQKATDCFINAKPVIPSKERKDTAVGEAQLYLPLVRASDQADGMNHSNLHDDKRSCDAANLGVLQVNYARGTISLTQVELELLDSIAQQCASALMNAESHHGNRCTQQQHEKLFLKVQHLFESKTSEMLFRSVCSITSELAPSEKICVFSVDAAGRHVEGEWTAAGPVSAAASDGYNLKLKVAIKALQGLALYGDISSSSLELDTNFPTKVPNHCFTTLLFKAGVAPRISKAPEMHGGASAGKNKSTVEMALFGVLVCIRPQHLGHYFDYERGPLESLAGMAAQHMLSFQSRLASKFLGQLMNPVLEKRSLQRAGAADNHDHAAHGLSAPTPVPVPVPTAIPHTPSKERGAWGAAAVAEPVVEAGAADVGGRGTGGGHTMDGSQRGVEAGDIVGGEAWAQVSQKRPAIALKETYYTEEGLSAAAAAVRVQCAFRGRLARECARQLILPNMQLADSLYDGGERGGMLGSGFGDGGGKGEWVAFRGGEKRGDGGERWEDERGVEQRVLFGGEGGEGESGLAAPFQKRPICVKRDLYVSKESGLAAPFPVVEEAMGVGGVGIGGWGETENMSVVEEVAAAAKEEVVRVCACVCMYHIQNPICVCVCVYIYI